VSDLGNARYVHRTRLALLLMLLLFPFVIGGTLRALHSLNDDVLAWTASSATARHELEWFAEVFESQSAILVSWPDATLDDPRMAQFAETLLRSAGGESENGRLIFDVVTGRELYDELVSSPLSLPHEEAIGRLRGTFVGPDGRATCAVVLLGEGAAVEARGVLRRIRDAAEQSGVATDDLRMVGYVVETAALDTAALETLYRLAIPSALLVILVAWPCLRSFRLALLVWLAAAFCQCSCLATIYWINGQMNGMMTVLPILLMVIFVSSAVHLINYYQEAAKESGPAAACALAVAMGWFPCLLAVLTTAIGLGSLALSGTLPVREFGIYSAIGTSMTLVVLLLVLPGAMHLAPHVPSKSEDSAEACPAGNVASRWSWDPLALFIERRGTLVLAAFLAITMVCGVGLTRLRGSVQLTDYLSDASRTAEDYRWFQQTIGPLLPVEIVIAFDRDCPLSAVERLDLVRDVGRAVESMPGPTASVSLAAFLPDPGRPGGSRTRIRRGILNRRLEARTEALALASPYLARANDQELWRINARLQGLDGQRYEETLAELEDAVEPVVRNAREQAGNTVSVIYTGPLPLLAECHSTLIRDLIVSFSVSLLLIAVVLVVGLRSLRLGLLSILPNVFPIALVFGILGWLGGAIDVGSMMTASVGLGIAVDGTVHYLTWFMRGRRSGLSRNAAILNAYRHSARAMTRTTVICGAGLAVYGFSSFLPAARFGWIVCLLLLAALAGDLLLLPALLAGRVGRVLFPDDQEPHNPEMGHPLALGSLRNWLGLLLANRGVDRGYLRRACFISTASFLTAPLRAVERIRCRRLNHGPFLGPAPVFVVGHWRSGTTFVHQSLCHDPAFGYVSTFQSIAPDWFLIGGTRIKHLLSRAVPRTRMMDNVTLSLDDPQEEEFAVAQASALSFYHQWAFPRNARRYFERYALFEGVPESVVRQWQEVYLGILRKAAWRAGRKRLALKNPVNMVRIRPLLELFPDAKFIHVYRNPYTVFLSTRHFFHRVLAVTQLQRIDHDEIEANILWFYEKMVGGFLAAKSLIPPRNLVEVRFEDFEAHPMAEMRRVYDCLELPGFDAAESRFRDYFASLAGYEKNRYDLDEDAVGKVERHWQFAVRQWGYERPPTRDNAFPGTNPC